MSSSSSLGPPFAYQPSPRAPSFSRHAPHPSEASTASSASRSSASGSSSHDARSSYTSYASSYCSYDDCLESDADDDGGSVLEDLCELSLSHESTTPDSPPRYAASTDSSELLRERTRYRSSASVVQPLQPRQRHHPNLDATRLGGGVGALMPGFDNNTAAAHLSFLATLGDLDRCFCGKDAEEDSIYCSRACAQTDALNALCGGSSAEDGSASDGASLRSGSSGGNTVESHYRRVEREEVRREKERQARAARERAAKKRGSDASSTSAKDRQRGGLWRSNVDVSSVKTSSGSSSTTSSLAAPTRLPPPRTSSRRTPSLSSSASTCSSAAPSPLTPSFPSDSHLDPSMPFIVEPPERPTTPLGHSPASPEVSDIYAAYLTATPLASDKLRTPTQERSTPRSGPTLPPTDDDSPTARGCDLSAVGLRMLQLCGSPARSSGHGEEDEARDRLESLTTTEGGWGGREIKERMARKGSTARGHTKGKLSFEDVVGILGA
ncbi:hypothetical protein JCM1840_004848 [Sporobolomyces johnsonii]